jgi:hypothetical protein
MDRKLLNSALAKFLDAYRTSRYQGVVVTVASEKELRQVQGQLEALLLDSDLWSAPGVEKAPDIPCSRRDFNDAVFSRRERTLLLISPREWMLDWPDTDQAVFWSNVADLYGRHSLCVVAVETPFLARQLRIEFIRHVLPGLAVSVWLSKHQPIDHLQEVLN